MVEMQHRCMKRGALPAWPSSNINYYFKINISTGVYFLYASRFVIYFYYYESYMDSGNIKRNCFDITSVFQNFFFSHYKKSNYFYIDLRWSYGASPYLFFCASVL